MLVANQLFSGAPGRYWNWLAVLVLPVGFTAAWYKKKNQLRYGTIEVVAGVLTAFAATFQQKDFDSPRALTVVGAAYVVARGFGNIKEARDKEEAKGKALIAEWDANMAAKR